MSGQVIANPAQLSIAWFEEVLKRNRALLTGGIRDFDVDVAGRVMSQIVRINLHYDADATGALPTKLLLKLCATDSNSFGASEVDYYARDYVDLASAPIPRCYDARYSAEHQCYHILVDDLSDTHQDNWQTVPNEVYGRGVAHALATLHAHHWGSERLNRGGYSLPTEEIFERYIGHIRPGLEPMLRDLADELDPNWSTALHATFEHHPQLMLARTKDGQGFTLIHGDPNPGNILSPRSGTGATYVIDRQPFDWSLTTWLGVSDVAYMMVHWWEPEQRRSLEWVVLRHYHDQLQAHGIANYTWEQLVADYKLCAVQSIYVATEWCVLDEDRVNMRWVWLPQLKRAMTAFFDLGCAGLWR